MPIRFDPLRELDRLAQSFGQLLNRPGPVRVDRGDEEIRLDIDLPGVRADDIELTVDADRVEVRAVRRPGPSATATDSPGTEQRHEYRIDDPIDVDRVRADYEDGVLTVHLPRTGGVRARRVPVRSGTGATAPDPAGTAAPAEGSSDPPAAGSEGGGTEPTPPPPGEQANPLPTS
jgi:HSP20 family protein